VVSVFFWIHFFEPRQRSSIYRDIKESTPFCTKLVCRHSISIVLLSNIHRWLFGDMFFWCTIAQLAIWGLCVAWPVSLVYRPARFYLFWRAVWEYISRFFSFFFFFLETTLLLSVCVCSFLIISMCARLETVITPFSFPWTALVFQVWSQASDLHFFVSMAYVLLGRWALDQRMHGWSS